MPHLARTGELCDALDRGRRRRFFEPFEADLPEIRSGADLDPHWPAERRKSAERQFDLVIASGHAGEDEGAGDVRRHLRQRFVFAVPRQYRLHLSQKRRVVETCGQAHEAAHASRLALQDHRSIEDGGIVFGHQHAERLSAIADRGEQQLAFPGRQLEPEATVPRRLTQNRRAEHLDGDAAVPEFALAGASSRTLDRSGGLSGQLESDFAELAGPTHLHEDRSTRRFESCQPHIERVGARGDRVEHEETAQIGQRLGHRGRIDAADERDAHPRHQLRRRIARRQSHMAAHQPRLAGQGHRLLEREHLAGCELDVDFAGLILLATEPQGGRSRHDADLELTLRSALPDKRAAQHLDADATVFERIDASEASDAPDDGCLLFGDRERNLPQVDSLSGLERDGLALDLETRERHLDDVVTGRHIAEHEKPFGVRILLRHPLRRLVVGSQRDGHRSQAVFVVETRRQRHDTAHDAGLADQHDRRLERHFFLGIERDCARRLDSVSLAHESELVAARAHLDPERARRRRLGHEVGARRLDLHPAVTLVTPAAEAHHAADPGALPVEVDAHHRRFHLDLRAHRQRHLTPRGHESDERYLHRVAARSQIVDHIDAVGARRRPPRLHRLLPVDAQEPDHDSAQQIRILELGRDHHQSAHAPGPGIEQHRLLEREVFARTQRSHVDVVALVALVSEREPIAVRIRRQSNLEVTLALSQREVRRADRFDADARMVDGARQRRGARDRCVGGQTVELHERERRALAVAHVGLSQLGHEATERVVERVAAGPDPVEEIPARIVGPGLSHDLTARVAQVDLDRIDDDRAVVAGLERDGAGDAARRADEHDRIRQRRRRIALHLDGRQGFDAVAVSRKTQLVGSGDHFEAEQAIGRGHRARRGAQRVDAHAAVITCPRQLHRSGHPAELGPEEHDGPRVSRLARGHRERP